MIQEKERVNSNSLDQEPLNMQAHEVEAHSLQLLEDLESGCLTEPR